MVDQLNIKTVSFGPENQVAEFNQDSIPRHLYPVNPQTQTQSTITPANQAAHKKLHCMTSLWTGFKKIIGRIYDCLSKCLPFLPKRKTAIQAQSISTIVAPNRPHIDEVPGVGTIVTPDPIECKSWADGLKTIEQSPDYQSNNKAFIKNLSECKRWADGLKTIRQSPDYQSNSKAYIKNLLKANGHYRYNTGDSVLDIFLQLHGFTESEPNSVFERNNAKEIDAKMDAIKKEPEYIKNPAEYLDAAIKSVETKTERIQLKDTLMMCALCELKSFLN